MSEWPLLILFNLYTETTSCDFWVINDLLNLHPSPLQTFEAQVSSSCSWTVTILAQCCLCTRTCSFTTNPIHHLLGFEQNFLVNGAHGTHCDFKCSLSLSGKHSLRLGCSSLCDLHVYLTKLTSLNASTILHSSNTDTELPWVHSRFHISGNFVKLVHFSEISCLPLLPREHLLIFYSSAPWWSSLWKIS